MYTKEQTSRMRQAFWTAFGKYMALQPSVDETPINWINYKTGIKNIHFRMDADHKHASISIEMTHPNPEIQELFFKKFMQVRTILYSFMCEDWDWELHRKDEQGKIFSSIGREISPVNLFDKNQWPEIISFLKPRIIALDQFWSEVKDGFQELE